MTIMRKRTAGALSGAAHRPPGLRYTGSPNRQAIHFPGALLALSVAAYLQFVSIDGPWLALTIRGLSLAFVLTFLLTRFRRYVVSGCLAASILLSSPSFFGEQSSVAAAGLAVVASVLSAAGQPSRFSQLGEGEIERGPRSVALVPLGLLCAYWTLMAVGSTMDSRAQIQIGYWLIFVAAAFVLLGDPGAVRETLSLMSLFVAVLGYAWMLITATYMLLKLDPAKVPASAYELRDNFEYHTWGPLLITNSSGFFGLMRVSDIGGEPGTWALFAALGAASAGVVFENRTRVRRFALTGGVVAILSSQSAGALVSLIAATVAVLAFTAARRSSGSTGSRYRLRLVVLAGLLAIGVLVVLNYMVKFKASGNASALTGRGLGFLSGIQGSGEAPGISLITALSADGFVAVLPLIGLVVLIAALRHNPYSCALAIYFSLMGMLVLPVQWHMGIWFGCALMMGIVGRNGPEASISRTANGCEPSPADSNKGFLECCDRGFG